MALELLDPNTTLEFIPKSEKADKNPTIIHLSLSDVRDSFRRNCLFSVNRDNGGKASVEFADDEVWFDYLVSRVVKIENVIRAGNMETVTDPVKIKDAMSRMTSAVGSELFSFIIENSGLSEEQRKN